MPFSSFENLVNKLNYLIYKYPHVIQSPNASKSFFVKINCTIVKKKKHTLYISVQDLHNDIILPIFPGRFFGARNSDGRLSIVDMCLKNYMPKYIKQMSNRCIITCRCETFISDMVLKSDLNK